MLQFLEGSDKVSGQQIQFEKLNEDVRDVLWSPCTVDQKKSPKIHALPKRETFLYKSSALK